MAVCIELKRWSATVQVTGLDDLLTCFRTREVAQTIFEVRKIAPLWWAAKKRGDKVNEKKYKGEMGKLKTDLPGVCFSASTFTPHELEDKKGKKKPMDTWRHQQFAVMNGLFMVDLDEVEDPKALWAQLVEKGGDGLETVLRLCHAIGLRAEDRDALLHREGQPLSELGGVCQGVRRRCVVRR